MSDSQIRFEINVNINNQDLNDIQIFTIYRCPISKTISFSRLTLNMRVADYLVLEDQLRNNDLKEIKLDIYQIDTKIKEKDSKLGRRIHHFCSKNYKIIQVKTNQAQLLNSSYVSCTLYLVNPILHFLNSNNTFNKVLNNITANDSIIEFENFIKSNYGETSFDFKKIGHQEELNTFKYEQILLRQDNDLAIPSFIIQNYKPFNTFSFYFFDDFNISKDTKADVVGYHINLASTKNFNRKDVHDKSIIESIGMATYKNGNNIIDSFDELSQENPHIIVKGREFDYLETKSTSKTNLPRSNTSLDEENINTDRVIKTPESNLSKNLQSPYQKIIIYAPDDKNKALDRYYSIRKQLRETLHSFDTYYIQNSYFDFYQFGYAYNMQVFNQSSYSFTPIGIVNTFVRDTFPVPLLTHNSWLQLLKFKEVE